MTIEPRTLKIKDQDGNDVEATSCPRCFAVVLAENAQAHAEWHKGSALATFFGGGL